MKVEKIETMKNKYPKFEELTKKSEKTKIGIITVSAIAFKSKLVSAISPADLEVFEIPGNMPIYLEPQYIASKYTTLGYIGMFIISIISTIVVKFKWKNYNSKQKKRAKIILGILFTLTILLIVITIILSKI